MSPAGVDGVFFGPADLSADMGLLGQPNHDDVAAAIKGGADRVRAVGKATGSSSAMPPWRRCGSARASPSSPAAATSTCLRAARAPLPTRCANNAG